VLHDDSGASEQKIRKKRQQSHTKKSQSTENSRGSTLMRANPISEIKTLNLLVMEQFYEVHYNHRNIDNYQACYSSTTFIEYLNNATDKN